MRGSGLLYIVSIGHSGSTLLDLLCGSIPGVFSTGELRYYPWQLLHGRTKLGSIENQNICSCLRDFDKCPVWTRVCSILTRTTGVNLKSTPLSFRIGYIRPQVFTRNIPWYFALIRKLVGWSLRTSGAGGLAALSRALNRRVSRNNIELITAICEVTGAGWVVDSTKDPLRFDHLYNALPDQTRLIILTRNPYGIAWSSEKRGRDPRPVVSEWLSFYGKLERMLRNIPPDKILPVTYEEVCSDPARTRRRIAGFLSLPDPSGMPVLDTRNNHIVAGNPMRYRGEVSILEDNSWREDLSSTSISMVSSLLRGKGLPDFLRIYSDAGKEGI